MSEMITADQKPADLSTSVLVTFDRIGRNHNVAALTVASTDPDIIAEAIYTHARPHLNSRDVEVYVDMDALSGTIFCGFNNGGMFTVQHTSPEVWL